MTPSFSTRMVEVLWLIIQSWKWQELHLEIQSQITSNHLWEGYLYGIPLFLCVLITKSLLSPSLPIYLYTPIYICSIFHTILCKYSGHLSPLSIYLSCLIYLSYLSPYLLSNIYYIYNKYPIYLSLPYNLYTHDNICSIFIIDYVNIQVISND